MALLTRGYVRMNSRDDEYLEKDTDDDESPESDVSYASDPKQAHPSPLLAEPEPSFPRLETLMPDETERQATAIMQSNSKSASTHQPRQSSIRLAAGTFQYESSASDIDISSPLLEVESVVMDSLFGADVTNDCVHDMQGAPETTTISAANSEASLVPSDSKGRPTASNNTSDRITKEFSQKEVMGIGEGNNGALPLLLISVLLASILFVALVIGMAVTVAKLWEARQKELQ